MYKAILSLLFVSSFSFAQIPATRIGLLAKTSIRNQYDLFKVNEEKKETKKPESLKDKAKQEMLEKHLAEQKKGTQDLRKAGYSVLVVSALCLSIGIANCVGIPQFVAERYGQPTSDNIGDLLFVATLSTAAYSIVKAYQGMKHMFKPDHPISYEISKN